MLAIAWGMLILWPVIAVILYNKYSLPVALCITLLGGYLLLPTQISFDLPLLPPFDKFSVPAFSALFLTMLAAGRYNQTYPVLRGWLPRSFLAIAFLTLFVVGGFGTIATNSDPLFYGPRVLRGLRVYDAFAFLLGGLIIIIPLLLGRKVLASVEGQRVLLSAIVISGFAYSFLAMWEVRMSPQLNVNFYGFFPHSFIQHMRGGGFRPLVFLDHGLSLSIFLSLAVLGGASLYRSTQGTTSRNWALITVWLFGALVLSKSFGALGITLVLLPVILFVNVRVQLIVAACIAGVVMTYPMLRAANVIPLDKVIAYAESIDPARAVSLNFRIENEEVLLAKAKERPIFGFGGWNRSRVFNSDGADISVTDGSWIIELGLGGWFRYIAMFGLLCWPLVGLFLSKRKRIDLVSTGLALMLGAKLFDLLPNAGLSVPYLWLIAGSLWGRMEMGLAELRAETPTPQDDAPKPRAAHGKAKQQAKKAALTATSRYTRTTSEKIERVKKTVERSGTKPQKTRSKPTGRYSR